MQSIRTTGMMLAALFFVALAGTGSCANSQGQKQKTPEDTVMKACTACHDTARICASLGKKDKAAWNSTIASMVDKGARVKPEQIGEIADYLSRLSPGSKPVCK